MTEFLNEAAKLHPAAQCVAIICVTVAVCFVAYMIYLSVDSTNNNFWNR